MMKVRFLTPCLMYRDVYMQRKNVYIVIKHTDKMSDNSFMWFKQTWFSTMDN